MCGCMWWRIHKPPVPELEGCPGASANPLSVDLGNYRFHSLSLFFHFFINSRSKSLLPMFVLFSFSCRLFILTFLPSSLLHGAGKSFHFFCISAECNGGCDDEEVEPDANEILWMKSFWWSHYGCHCEVNRNSQNNSDIVNVGEFYLFSLKGYFLYLN